MQPTAPLHFRQAARRSMPSLAILWAAAVMTGCDSPAETVVEEQPPALETIEADVLTIDHRPWPTVIRSQGSLYADEQSVVGAKVAGRVADVHVDFGDFVKAGDPLVTLDQEEFELRLAQAEAQLQQARSAVGLRAEELVEKLDPENAPPVREAKAMWEQSKSTLQRAGTLRDQDAIAEAELDSAEAAERVSEAKYASALNSVREKIAIIGVRQAESSLSREQLKDTVIRAPLDGYIRQRDVAPGTYVTVGQSIAVLVCTHPLRFRGTVPEKYAQSLAIGQQVRLKIESLPEPRTAEITRVSPALNRSTRSLEFEAEIDNGDHQLRTGLFVEAELVVDPSAKALVLPVSAITEFAGIEKVWKIIDGVAADHEVLTGGQRGAERIVLQGLAAGDMILVDAVIGRIAIIKPKLVQHQAGLSEETSGDDQLKRD